MSMGLPFLPNRRIQSILVGRKEDGKPMELPESEHPLTPAMEDFARAHEAKDHSGMAKAFHSAFQMLDSMPHQEGDNE